MLPAFLVALFVFEEVVGVGEQAEFERGENYAFGFDEFEIGLAGEDRRWQKRLDGGLHDGSVMNAYAYGYGRTGASR